MLKGKMHLDLDDGDRKERLQADIPRCIDSEQEIAFEFNSDDSDAGAFQGKAKLGKNATEVVGDGQLRWADGSIMDVTLRGSIEYFNDQIIIEGQWFDEGNGDEYDFFIELETDR